MTLAHESVDPKRQRKLVREHDLREPRKEIELKFLNWDVKVDDNVKEFGDVSVGLKKAIFSI